MNIKTFLSECVGFFKPFGIEGNENIPLAIAIERNISGSQLRGFFLNGELVHVAVAYDGFYIDEDGVQSTFEIQDKVADKFVGQALSIQPVASETLKPKQLSTKKFRFLVDSFSKLFKQLKVNHSVIGSVSANHWMNDARVAIR